MKTRRGAILGFGHVAEHGHLPVWRCRADVRIVAVADPAAQRRARAATLIPTARVYDDPFELLRREELHFVDIATPPSLHAPLAVAAAGAGCHVLCEKPLTADLSGFRSILAALERSRTTLCTVHNWKHSPQFERVAALVAAGAIGSVERVCLETVRRQPAAAVDDGWRARAAIAGGGILVDHGWHSFYLLSCFVGQKPVRAGATIARRRWVDVDVEDTAVCRIEFPSASGEIRLTWAGEQRRSSWELFGSEGQIRLHGKRMEMRRGSRVERFDFDQSLAQGSQHPEWFAPVIRDFFREIDGESERGANLGEAASCLALLAVSYASAAQGGALTAVTDPLQTVPGSGQAFKSEQPVAG